MVGRGYRKTRRGGGLVYVFREYVQPSGLGIKPWDEIKQGLKVMSIKLQCEN